MNFHDVDRAALTPPMPPMASNDISGLQILIALRRNAFLAFPRRCLDQPVVKLQAAWQTVVLTCAPDVIRHVMMTHADDYGRLPLGRRVLGPIAGSGLLTSEGELWRRQRRAMAPAFAPRNLSVMAGHIARSVEMACARLAQSCGAGIDLLSELQILSLEIAAIHRLAVVLCKGLMTRDPLSEKVHHGKAAFALTALGGVLSTLVRRPFRSRAGAAQ